MDVLPHISYRDVACHDGNVCRGMWLSRWLSMAAFQDMANLTVLFHL